MATEWKSGRETANGAPDERKSAAVAARDLPEGARHVSGYKGVRSMLRDTGLSQAGFKAELIEKFRGTSEPPVLFMSGKAHRQRRQMSAHFFSPQKVRTTYRPLIETVTKRLVQQFRTNGKAQLDQLSLVLAVEVASSIIGLTNSDPAGLTRRLDAFFSLSDSKSKGWLQQAKEFFLGQFHLLHFYIRDVRPAMAARRNSPSEDVISHLLSEGKSTREILAECVTYGAAGMVTTREFITMAAWHLLDRAALKEQFITGSEQESTAILEEILRLEPVVGTLFRRDKERQLYALDIRSANTDTEAFGSCPFHLDHDRETASRVPAHGLSFGDGPHRCPGSEVALLETEIFLKELLQVPGLKMDTPPDLDWNNLLLAMSCETASSAANKPTNNKGVSPEGFAPQGRSR